jgi:hypothetical protein
VWYRVRQQGVAVDVEIEQVVHGARVLVAR